MQVAGLVIAGAAGAAILVVGLLYLLDPRATAASFGLPVIPPEDATPWLRLKGIRDAVTGIVAGVLLLTAPSDVVGWCVLAFALIPVGDAVTVLRAGGSRGAAWGIHGATAAVMLVGAVLLLV